MGLLSRPTVTAVAVAAAVAMHSEYGQFVSAAAQPNRPCVVGNFFVQMKCAQE